MERRFRFTLNRLRELPPAPAGKRVMYHDTKLSFFKCRVTPAGTKTLIIAARIGKRCVKEKVWRLRGEELDPSIETLRARAREIFLELENAPAPGEKRNVPTFGTYVETWAESAEMQNIVPSWRESKLSAARQHCGPIEDIKLDEITRADVRNLLTGMLEKGLKGMPRIVRTIINQVYELAIDNGVLPEDHAIPIPRGLKIKVNKRDRRLNGEELARLFNALSQYKGNDRADAESFRLVVLLALFTAQRRGNVLKMRWDEIDNINRVWTIPAEKAKTRRPYRVGLHDLVWRLLQQQRKNLMLLGLSGPWVFPSYASSAKHMEGIVRPWTWLVREAKLQDFRFHDLRHSAASIAYEASHDLKGTQMFLQHADSRTTADRYIHTADVAPQVQASGAVIDALALSVGIKADELITRAAGNAGPDADQEEASTG